MAANVKDNLLKMKNISELITDLAYSALFLQDKNIAAEVENLHNRMRNLEDETTKLLFRVKTLSEEERLVIMDLIDEVKDISGSAKRIGMLAKEKNFPDIIKDILSETDERVLTATVKKNSALIGTEVTRDSFHHLTYTDLVAIKRGNEYLFERKNVQLKEGDTVIAVGPASAAKQLKDLATGKSQKT